MTGSREWVRKLLTYEGVTGRTWFLREILVLLGLGLLFGTMFLDGLVAIIVFAAGWLVLAVLVFAYKKGRI